MADFRFLYRQAEGRIGPGQWARASAGPVGIALAMTLVAWGVLPGPRDLATQPFFLASRVVAHAYLLVYGFALIFLSVAQYFVSAKRFNDLGKSSTWACLAPFALLLAGSAAWFQPRSEGFMPEWTVWPFYVLALGIVGWNVVELGFTRGTAPKGARGE